MRNFLLILMDLRWLEAHLTSLRLEACGDGPGERLWAQLTFCFRIKYAIGMGLASALLWLGGLRGARRAAHGRTSGVRGLGRRTCAWACTSCVALHHELNLHTSPRGGRTASNTRAGVSEAGRDGMISISTCSAKCIVSSGLEARLHLLLYRFRL